MNCRIIVDCINSFLLKYSTATLIMTLICKYFIILNDSYIGSGVFLSAARQSTQILAHTLDWDTFTTATAPDCNIRIKEHYLDFLGAAQPFGCSVS